MEPVIDDSVEAVPLAAHAEIQAVVASAATPPKAVAQSPAPPPTRAAGRPKLADTKKPLERGQQLFTKFCTPVALDYKNPRKRNRGEQSEGRGRHRR